MPLKRRYTVTQVIRKQSLFQTAVPFDVVLNGEIIATVVKPKGVWRECENCKENTQNIIQFQDENLNWKEIILCDKCSEQLLR
jgi:hypothetical protein